MKYILSIGWLTLTISLLLVGCVKRELESRVEEGYAEVMPEWSTEAPLRSARYLFYNESGELVREANGLTNGFKDNLPPGKYHLIVHNEDARQVDFRGMNTYETAEVFALPVSNTRAPRVADLPCILEPQDIHGTGICKEGEWIIVEPGKTTRVTIQPVALTRQVQFRFVVKGDIMAQSLTGILGGVVPGIFLATGEPNRSETCAIQFSATISSSRQSRETNIEEFAAGLNVFNLLTTADSPAGTNTIDVTLTDVSGDLYQATVDFTSALQQIIDQNGGAIPVEIPIEVTLEVVPVKGIISTVEPWKDGGIGGGKPYGD